MKTSKYILLSMMALAALSCTQGQLSPDPAPDEEDIQTHHEQYFDGKYYHDIPNDGWEKQTKERADAMLLQWTPLADVAGSFLQPGKYFTEGQTVTGAPYSSVQEELCQMGRDVSFYTFLSSVHNPKSLLYTTDYRTPASYKSKSTYYGSTCTCTIDYVWGLRYAFSAKRIYYQNDVPIRRRKSDNLLKVQLFDMVDYWSDEENDGHTMMIYDIARNMAGRIMELTVFESAHPTSRLTKYTVDEYQARLDEQARNGHGIYHIFYFEHEKYADKYALPSYMEQSPSQIGTDFPTALCLDRGDRVTYEKDAPVTINILSGAYSQIELYKDGALFRTRALNGTDDVIFEGLPVGMYEARLADGGSRSEATRFEVADGTFSVSYDGDSIIITDLKNEMLWISMNSGLPVYQVVPTRVSPGVWRYSGNLGEATHVRVHYGGKYSRYSGNSIKFR